MKLNYLAFVLPAFFIFCALEYYLSIKKEKKFFRFGETISNLNVGIFERTCDLFTTIVFHFYFVWLYENFALFEIGSSIVTWILLFLATDLLWYWYHRLGHRVNILWSAHVVHHQSDDFNFTVSARITIFQALFRSLFWSFIPILGFPPEMITIILLIHGAYPFFTHTQLVGKLGVIEKVFVTPSHHRVHHSSNEKYLDKNFGDVLIIWDKIFGTYIEEDENEKTVYGITSPLNSYSFLWQHFHFLMEIVVSFKHAKGLKAKLNTIFGTPETIDPQIRHNLESLFLSKSSQKDLSENLRNTIVVNTVITLVFVFFYLLFGYHQNVYEITLGCLFVLLSVIHTGAMLEQRKWIFHIEFLRITILSLYVSLLLPTYWFVIPALLLLTVLALFYKSAHNYYLQFLNIKT
jgi:sterol desaturase/sphingolipid hydroxylase (fatty acid hydroxylase superfamily)